jgi:hypothetical protein
MVQRDADKEDTNKEEQDEDCRIGRLREEGKKTTKRDKDCTGES